MYRLRVSEHANQDLDNIISYIVVQLVNPSAASRLLDEIEKCYAFLKSNPEMYEICTDSRLAKENYRKVVISNYILIYKIVESEKTIIVLRFFYSARDYIKLI